MSAPARAGASVRAVGGPARPAIEAHRPAAALSLLASASTLLCCALPALLVSLGAGAALAALVGAVPQLVWLSERKVGLFVAAGLVLAAAGALQWRARRLPCPTDPAAARACGRARRASLGVWWASVCAYAAGATVAFVLPALG